MEQFKGTGVALVTPFLADKSVDYKGLKRLVEHNIAGGIDYLVVHGTTGESATLKLSEKQAVLDFIVGVNDKRLPIVLGNGGNDTYAVIDAFHEYDLSGVDGILCVSPYYNKPTQEGIYQHYKAICQVTDLPIILYNVPSRTASNMEVETVVRLANDFDNIVAVKEASGDLNQVSELLAACPSDFLIISGDDGLTVPMMALGAHGLISVVGNALPAETSRMVNAGSAGDFQAARKEHFALASLITCLFKEGNPAGVKMALSQLGVLDPHVRLPLWPISDQLEVEIKNELNKLGKL